MVRVTVNGSPTAIDAPSGQTLLGVLRDDLGLTGTKYGCGEGECGACTVLVDGSPVRACTVAVDTLEGAAITTVEGLAGERGLHPVQQAFVDARALQCGYCTPGMVMSAVALLARDPSPGDAAITEALAGNVCRCGGYPRILQAVREAAVATSTGTDAPVGRAEASARAPTGQDREGGAAWTVVLPALAPESAGERGWGWSTPGGARLTIDDRGTVRAFTGKVDGGQGNRAALTRLVAAELGARTDSVLLEMGDTDLVPFDLGTFGSRSTPDAGRALRVVAAGARRALLEAAAARWGTPVEDLAVLDGVVREAGGPREVTVAELVSAGSRTIEVEADGAPATAHQRLDELDDAGLRSSLAAAVTGAKRFPSDLTLPGMLHARVLRPPAHGATLRAVDTAAARATPGLTVVERRGLVAVAAPTRRAATDGLCSVKAQWDPPADTPAEADLAAWLRSHSVEERGWGGATAHEAGDVEAARAAAHLVLEASYATAYLAHVPMEPRVALARVADDRATVWVGTQRPFAVRAEVAAALGLAEQQVRVVVPDFGGGFGGKHTGDVAVEAAQLAQATGRPVRVAWSREEELRFAYFRPAAVIDVRSGVDAGGRLTSWELTNWNSGAAGLHSPYRTAHQRERFQPAASPLAQGAYRALAATANHFARESHMDELARALRADPLDLRLTHLEDERLRDVLIVAADRVGWSPMAIGSGTGVGLACGVEKDARVATAAEVRVGVDGRVQVLRIVTAFDCGAVVDPTGLRNQVVGATVMGLGGALFEAVHFDGGRILGASLAEYRVPRFADVPPIEVVVVDRPECAPAGAGETPIIAVAPAIANAVDAACGRRVRALPLTHGGILR